MHKQDSKPRISSHSRIEFYSKTDKIILPQLCVLALRVLVVQSAKLNLGKQKYIVHICNALEVKQQSDSSNTCCRATSYNENGIALDLEFQGNRITSCYVAVKSLIIFVVFHYIPCRNFMKNYLGSSWSSRKPFRLQTQIEYD